MHGIEGLAFSVSDFSLKKKNSTEQLNAKGEIQMTLRSVDPSTLQMYIL